MIRKFNYTGRKKIRRSDVRVEIFREEDGSRYFDIHLRLDEAALPPEARVYVEAYHRTGYQRFDFGAVGMRKMPSDRRLVRISSTAVPLFRVKVVDRSETRGRILASVDRIRPEKANGEPVGGQALLHVEYEDLGNAVWQLDLEGDWPVLKLNGAIEEIGQIAGSDDRFQALVYPEALRQVLSRILLVDEHTDPDCDDDWPSLWLKMASGLPGMSIPPSGPRVEHEAWIEQAVNAFCGRNDTLRRFQRSYGGGK